MVRVLFIFALLVAAASAFVAPAQRAGKSLQYGVTSFFVQHVVLSLFYINMVSNII
jgi:hypothetical protein